MDTCVILSLNVPSSFHLASVSSSPLVWRDRLGPGPSAFPRLHSRGQMRGEARGSPSPEALMWSTSPRSLEVSREAWTLWLSLPVGRGPVRQLGHARLQVGSWLRLRTPDPVEREIPGRHRHQAGLGAGQVGAPDAVPEVASRDRFPQSGGPGSVPDLHGILPEHVAGREIRPAGTAEIHVASRRQEEVGEGPGAEHGGDGMSGQGLEAGREPFARPTVDGMCRRGDRGLVVARLFPALAVEHIRLEECHTRVPRRDPVEVGESQAAADRRIAGGDVPHQVPEPGVVGGAAYQSWGGQGGLGVGWGAVASAGEGFLVVGGDGKEFVNYRPLRSEEKVVSWVSLADSRAALDELLNWGIPTTECLVGIHALKQREPEYGAIGVIASGGIRNGLDVAKSLALGADIAASARHMLVALHAGTLDEMIRAWSNDLRAAMFLTGSATIEELKRAPINHKP